MSWYKLFNSNQNEDEDNVSKDNYVNIYGISIDDFLDNFKVKKPNYLKIDVDGNELSILSGAENLLKSHDLKSVCIEISKKNIKNFENIKLIMENNEFLMNLSNSYAEVIFVRK